MDERKNSRNERMRELRTSIKENAKDKRKTPSTYAQDPMEKWRDAYKNEPQETKPQETKPKDKTKLAMYIAVCLTMVAAIFTICFTAIYISQNLEVMSLRKQYTPLQQLVNTFHIEHVAYIEQTWNDTHISLFDESMREINPDYICWIKIDGTAIDYPVVRAMDNEKYLNLSFFGEESQMGALFMDYRCTNDTPHVIIYGHNVRQGDMFGGLRRFHDEHYRLAHPIITIMVNDRIIEYEIFSVRRTDIYDPAYFLDFSLHGSFGAFAERNGAPPDAAQIITLSTCISEGNDNERLIVQGVLRD
jgi:sortase B